MQENKRCPASGDFGVMDTGWSWPDHEVSKISCTARAPLFETECCAVEHKRHLSIAYEDDLAWKGPAARLRGGVTRRRQAVRVPARRFRVQRQQLSGRVHGDRVRGYKAPSRSMVDESFGVGTRPPLRYNFAEGIRTSLGAR